MGGRFWISGVTLGMIIAYAEMGEVEKIEELVDEIIDKQYIPYKKFIELGVEKKEDDEEDVSKDYLEQSAATD